MNPHTRCLLIAAAVVMMSGCGGPSSGETPPAAASSAYEDALADALRRQGEGAGDEQEQHAQAQEFMTECMRKEGFTYHASAPTPATHEALGLTDREFKVQYGRGVSTLISYRQAQTAAAPEDPNERALQAMSEAERQAFGEARVKCEQAMVIEIGIIPSGQHRLPSSSPLTDLIRQAVEDSQADPRLTSIIEQWADCMREQGFDYRTGESLEQELHNRTEPLRQAYVNQGQALVSQGRAWDELTVEEVLTADQLDTLRAVQAFERAAVGAEIVCEDRGIDVRMVAAEVQAEYIRNALEDS